MKTILITGASGLIGQRLTEILLEKGFIVRHLSRKKGDGMIPTFIWNTEKKEIDKAAFENADAIIHLSGTNIYEKRWSVTVKKNIYNSRINGTKFLIQSLKENPNQVKTIVSASGIGYYGNRKNEIVTEETESANSFLGNVCRDWENEVRKAETINIRAVQLRTGIVLAKNSGAMKELELPLKFFIRPIFLPGSQHWSWIHLDDVCNLYIHAIENKNMNGAYNAVAPQSVSYSEFIKTLARVMRIKTLPAPATKWMLKIISGEFAEALFEDCNCSAKKVLDSGFQFQFPELENAVKNLLSK
jgi:uncharacterized protein (TIGR01777 family)